jgi:glycerophosphoryl diester phosphodiesterase
MWGDKTGGQKAAQLICETLDSIPKDKVVSKVELFGLFTEKIGEFYRREDNLYETVKKNPWERMTASVVVYSRHHHQVWMVGDCQCLIDEKLFLNTKEVDRVLAETRSFILELEIMKDRNIKEADKIAELRRNDAGRAFIHPLLAEQSYFQNLPEPNVYSYGVIDGFPLNERYIKTIDVGNAEYIILASDGYPRLFPTWEETEANLKSLLAEDPLCFRKLKSTKGVLPGNDSYDDRAYLKLKLQ